MGYYDVKSKDKDVLIGREIYDNSLYGRRGFRDDQIGIEETKLWREIFKEIGCAARQAVEKHT
jgi:hypothetical protein